MSAPVQVSPLPDADDPFCPVHDELKVLCPCPKPGPVAPAADRSEAAAHLRRWIEA